MTGVGGDCDHRLGGRPEQQVVNLRLVVKGDVGDLGGHGEDHVEVADRQQICLACGEPLACHRPLTFGAVPIPAANGRRPLPALWANPVMGSWRRLDRALLLAAANQLTITRCAGGARSVCRTAGTRRAADAVERSIPSRRASLLDRRACRFQWSSEWRALTRATP